MFSYEYGDPAKVVENQEDVSQNCRGCKFNEKEKTDSGFHWRCELGRDQRGGARGKLDCDMWYPRRGVR